ncbi:MAG: 16S rRNA (cytidine(1402)-2'-O)-methyltransferase [Acidimicrobiia bacterium]|nr:16S rRNA (cytidine(1402)-2'-O)-methyltransferase [Acidimicrobiia bacterium]
MSGGRLVLVGTPIGNLADLTPRAAEALGAADVIACEDTRRTGRLLAHLGIPAPTLVVLNEHTEFDRADDLLVRVRSGQTVAVVSDAGMPGVSDPGELVVAAAVAADLAVEVVPGPSAVLAALVVSGLTTSRFVFEGFLPRKGSARSARLADVASEARTTVLFEAPHRMERTLVDLVDACGADRPVVLARELTKRHEEIRRGTLAEMLATVRAAEPRGEFVLVLAGAPPRPEATDEEIRGALDGALRRGLTTRDAVAEVVAALGAPHRRVYELALTR